EASLWTRAPTDKLGAGLGATTLADWRRIGIAPCGALRAAVVPLLHQGATTDSRKGDSMKTLKLPAAAMLLAATALGSAGAHAARDDKALAAGVRALEQEQGAAIALQARERAAYPDYFEQAYERYPSLPRGVLEAIAYAETNWTHVQPDPHEASGHRLMPASHGVMGLYRGEGFANQVAEGAKLLGVSERLVMLDPETNILAAAALLARAAKADGHSARAGAGVEAMAGALARYAGYGSGDGNIQGFARQSFAYE